MPTSRLVTIIRRTLRRQRELHRLTQRELAELADVSQATIARIERGDRVPSIPLLEQILAALDSQLTVTVEPLDAHLDARIDELAGQPLTERIADTSLDRTARRLGDLPYVLTGATAALLQGAPVPADATEIALSWADSARFTAWLADVYAQRWNARWQQFGHLRLEPEEPGDHRWSTSVGEIRATMCDTLPEAIEVRHGERSYRVVPLAQVEITDPGTAALLHRYRTLQSGGADRRPGSAG
ncbi:helix-turn-helix transcriptional regulator [Micromonospora sp. CPCC 206060]|uniref:helix-turn-helix transcriptional regulator n=1 Tax=Micromonospora sp. CPCC 206060 TaxID=3122406 RepID=UPI002FF3B606